MNTITERCKLEFAALGFHLQITSSVITNIDVLQMYRSKIDVKHIHRHHQNDAREDSRQRLLLLT